MPISNYLNFDTSQFALIIYSGSAVLETINLSDTGFVAQGYSQYSRANVHFICEHSDFIAIDGTYNECGFRGYRAVIKIKGYLDKADLLALGRVWRAVDSGEKVIFRPFQNFPDYEFEIARPGDFAADYFGAGYEKDLTFQSKHLYEFIPFQFDRYYWCHSGHSINMAGTANECLFMAHQASLDTAADLTLDIWFRPSALQDNTLHSKGALELIELNADGSIDWKPNAGTVISTPIDTYAADGNYHLRTVFVEPPGNSYIYINGGRVAFGASVGVLGANANDLVIGADGGKIDEYAGRVDEYMRWVEARTTAMLFDYTNIEYTNFYCRVWLRMNDGVGNPADTTRNGNNFTLNGASPPTWLDYSHEIWDANYPLAYHWSDDDTAYVGTDELCYWNGKATIKQMRL